MAKKQTRRSISVRGVTYNLLRDHCATASISMSDFVEQRIADFFKDRKVPVAAPALSRPVAAPTLSPIRKAPLAPAPVPAMSTIVKKPAVAIAALRSAAPAPGSNSMIGKSAGRPAPTPAADVLKERYAITKPSRDGKDYRAIRF